MQEQLHFNLLDLQFQHKEDMLPFTSAIEASKSRAEPYAHFTPQRRAYCYRRGNYVNVSFSHSLAPIKAHYNKSKCYKILGTEQDDQRFKMLAIPYSKACSINVITVKPLNILNLSPEDRAVLQTHLQANPDQPKHKRGTIFGHDGQHYLLSNSLTPIAQVDADPHTQIFDVHENRHELTDDERKQLIYCRSEASPGTYAAKTKSGRYQLHLSGDELTLIERPFVNKTYTVSKSNEDCIRLPSDEPENMRLAWGNPSICSLMQQRKYLNTYTKFFFTQQRLPGIDLFTYLTERSQDAWDDPLTLRADAHRALTFARHLAKMHSQGIIHRDLKPENIIVNAHDTESGPIDFEYSININKPNENHCFSGGTPCYVGPEILNDGYGNDPSLDIYPASIILAGLLGGELFIIIEEKHKLYEQTCENQQPDFKEVITAPPSFNTVLEIAEKEIRQPFIDFLIKMASNNPSDRPNAQEVLSFLETHVPILSEHMLAMDKSASAQSEQTPPRLNHTQ